MCADSWQNGISFVSKRTHSQYERVVGVLLGVLCLFICVEIGIANMREFKNNTCRICNRIFCCIKCRKRHEFKQHDVYPDCNICMYKRISITDIYPELLDHIYAAHWPLHCIYCKKVYSTKNELNNMDNQCPIGCQNLDVNAPETPPISNAAYDFPNKPSDNKFLVTSTPSTSRSDELMLANIQDMITPVDRCIAQVKINKSDQTSSTSERKVTFCETPCAETRLRQKNLVQQKENQDKNKPIENYSSTGFTETPTSDSSQFYSIHQPCHDDVLLNDKENTLWLSATNISINNVSVENIINEKIDKSYSGPKFGSKPKPSNIVIPIPRKNVNTPLSSTANAMPRSIELTDESISSLSTIHSNSSMFSPKRIVSRVVKSVVNRFSRPYEPINPRKRPLSEWLCSHADADPAPPTAKRFKASDIIQQPPAGRIKCRRTYRPCRPSTCVRHSRYLEESANEYFKFNSRAQRKVMADKTTQTES